MTDAWLRLERSKRVFCGRIVQALHVPQAVDALARLLPAPGFWCRVKARWVLVRLPHYRKFKRHLRSIWRGI